MKSPQSLDTCPNSCRIEGPTGETLRAVTERWLLVAPDSNPAMLEAFDDRDTKPYRDLVPWAGEFPGKHLTAAVAVLRLTGDPRLEAFLREFVGRLIARQDADGYLGVWPRDGRLRNWSPHYPARGGRNWDTWSHYHIMLGLLGWHEHSGERRAMASARKIADLMCRMYLGGKSPRLVETGEPAMNLAPVHALAMLYRRTGVKRYLELAEQIVGEFSAGGAEPLAGDFVRLALAGKAFFEMPRPRWETLHSIMALAELHWATGNDDYRRAFEQIWWSIAQGDRHNNGGFSSAEQGTGNPYDPRAIETCCTVAWIALGVEMLKLTGNSVVADEVELATLNSALGMASPTGRWATYNTPSDGLRFASAHEIAFQARAGAPELNCCSVNSPRGLGLLSDWAVMQSPGGIYVNYYGPSRFSLPLAGGGELKIVQETDYPVSGRIRLRVEVRRPAELTLHLRVPHWSLRTRVAVNGRPVGGISPGTYLLLRRRWRQGDQVAVELDMSLHFWRGERECRGLTSVYRGPVLLAYDLRYNRHLKLRQASEPYGGSPPKPGVGLSLNVPRLDARTLRPKKSSWRGDGLVPALLLEVCDARGRIVRLCDFASAGQTGTPYRSWLPISNGPAVQPFSRSNPLRSAQQPAI
jgi:DUF1680 family protein